MAYKIKKTKERVITPELRYAISKMDKKGREAFVKGLKPSNRKKFLREWFGE